jgi:hypothetical protein
MQIILNLNFISFFLFFSCYFLSHKHTLTLQLQQSVFYFYHYLVCSLIMKSNQNTIKTKLNKVDGVLRANILWQIAWRMYFLYVPIKIVSLCQYSFYVIVILCVCILIANIW